MKIDSSVINMESNRSYVNYTQKKEFSTIMSADEAAKLELSDSSKSYVDQLKDYVKDKESARKQQQNENLAKNMSAMLSQNKKVEMHISDEVKGNEKIQLEVLKRILESLNKYLGKGKRTHKTNDKNNSNKNMNDSFKEVLNGSISASSNFSLSASSSIMVASGGVATPSPTAFVRTTAMSSFVTELENTTFKAQGLVKTADGREISFGVDLEMSRAFCARYNSLSEESVIFTDPLVINMDENINNVSDQKFMFDIDCDGEEEDISSLNQGGGFLALDKNNDGKINDGSELFGTKSGNGFKDLAEYDSDGNGWIDENDNIYNQLKVWTKDEEGNDRIISIKEAGVGAIYLGYVDTEFTQNNLETNGVNGVVRNTGIFLKEDGGVGTIQHIDLAL